MFKDGGAAHDEFPFMVGQDDSDLDQKWEHNLPPDQYNSGSGKCTRNENLVGDRATEIRNNDWSDIGPNHRDD